MADYIRPTPRNPILGLLADALTGGVDWMRDPRRTQQMQGLGGLLAETGIPASVERLSYGEPLTKGKGMTTRLRPEAEAALMTLGPEAVPIGRGAMAAVKATKGLPVGAATVYHGSPYRFQRFDPTKIGTGEGAQSYGYGHYVAESPGVAKSYAEKLATTPDPIINIDPSISSKASTFITNALKSNNFDSEKAINALFQSKQLMQSKEAKQAASEAINALKHGRVKTSGIDFPQGSLYTIDLPDPAIARMLDWDKPLSQQPENVREALKVLDPYVSRSGEKMWSELAYPGFASTPTESPRAAAEFLRQAGIPGIRYLDQGSRSNFRVQNTYKGQPYGEPVSFMTEQQAKDYAAEQIGKGFGTNILPGTSNFVVFPGEEDLLRILNVEGGLLGR